MIHDVVLKPLVITSLTILAQSQGATADDQPIVARVDHILISTNQAEPVFKLLTETLALPVAWPMRSYGVFVSGGVFAGNVNIEILADSGSGYSRDDDPRNEGAGKNTTRLAGVAFEPADSAESAVTALDARGLDHGHAAPFIGFKDGQRKKLWTTVFLQGFGTPGFSVFICDYAHDVEAHRAPLREALAEKRGGSMGIKRVSAIVIGQTEIEQQRPSWASLLSPHRADDSAWTVGDGPRIRLVPADHPDAMTLELEVSSLDQVREFAAEHDELQLIERNGEHRLISPLLGQLGIRIMESP